jgi:hypothetical protein
MAKSIRLRHQQRLAVAAGIGLAAAFAVPTVSAQAIGGTAAPSAPRAVQVHPDGRSARTGTMLTDHWVAPTTGAATTSPAG